MSLQEDINFATKLVLCGVNRERIARTFIDFVEDNYIKKSVFNNLTIGAAIFLNNTCRMELSINDGKIQEILNA